MSTHDAGALDAKRAMRARMRATLGTLAQERFVDGGGALSQRVLELAEIKRARLVVAFVPMRREGRLAEAQITALLDGVVAAGVRLALPRGDGDGLVACEVGEDWRGSLVESAFKGVLEPGPGAGPLAPGEVDVVIVPGLAFDAHGGRLGRGKGLYDRFLGGLAGRAALIGVCLEEQVVDCVPREAHDALVHCVVTDVRTMRVV